MCMHKQHAKARSLQTLRAPVPCPGRRLISARGFTLVEILVVLLIVGMVSGLLFDGATQVMNVQARLERQLTTLRGEALHADWLRQVVQGLQPDYSDGKRIFKGSARGFSGLTTNPLSAGYAGLQPFQVTLAHDASRNAMLLGYSMGSDATILLSWRGERGRLLYLDSHGEAHDEWPPPLGLWPQLPGAITLEGERDGTPWLIVAAHFGPSLPLLRPRDLMGIVGAAR